MTDKELLNEIALNSREITHPEWGTFIINRPTNRILSQIASTRTRALNRDLQEREKVFDPSTEKYKLVPAFLTKQGKKKILEEFGDWTPEDDEKIKELEQRYRQVCVALEREGFEGVVELNKSYTEALQALQRLLESKSGDYSEELPILFPMDYASPEGEETERTPERYAKARASVERKAKDIEVVEVLGIVDKLYKQYDLLMQGIKAQGDLYVKKIEEITLFSDTAESRADKEAQLVKIQSCTKNPDKSLVWASSEDCQNEPPDKLSWLLTEIEKFERLDPNQPDNDKVGSKYNFLSPILDTLVESDDSPEEETSKQDGDPVAKTA